MCRCPVGYRGLRCEERVRACLSQPCRHGARCTELQAGRGFTCTCATGFTGQYCETEVDPCDPNPCLRGAKCVPQLLPNSNPSHSKPGMAATPDGDTTFPKESSVGYDAVFTTSGSPRDKTQFPSESPGVDNPPSSTGVFWNDPLLQSSQPPERYEALYPSESPETYKTIYPSESLERYDSMSPTTESPFNDALDATTGSIFGKTMHPTTEVRVNGALLPTRKAPVQTDYATSPPTDPAVDAALFRCECSSPYTGPTCETVLQASEDCAPDSSLTCLNGGVCRRKAPSTLEVCECGPRFYGPDCAKKKSPNFDLEFIGDGGHAQYQWSLDIGNSMGGQTPGLTLCLWVKFLDSESSALYLTAKFSDRSTLYLTGESVTSTRPALSKPLPSGDSQWHHVCLAMSDHNTAIYRDGRLSSHLALDLGRAPQQRLSLTLGSTSSASYDLKPFTGLIHGLNVYGSLLSAGDIKNSSLHCNMSGGDVFDWATLDSYVGQGRDLPLRMRMPSTCQPKMCLGDSISAGCLIAKDIAIETDRTAPVVVKCPSTQLVTDDSGPVVVVTWEDPEFSDNGKITRVEQNLRPGVVLPYGEYVVTYVAYDAENNSASCSFHVYVRKFNCTDPPPPVNGARVCGEWTHGRYCIPSCNSRHQMVRATPPFYRCGLEGTWDPGKVHSLLFPVCARVHPSAYAIYGDARFTSNSGCASGMKDKLRAKISLILGQLQDVLDLCKDWSGDCDYQSELDVKCASRDSSSARRSKRTVAVETEYPVQLRLNLTSG
ncbi:hypothetical protein EGW08_019067, partial [Elysia chlorotica]